ncbi:MAG: hypothetical protein Q8P31_10335 [Bacillota bacterium]|nr:hypothetical protein [Bacillota bacterium]
MAAFSFASIPWWGWVLLVVAVIVVAPLKLRILKSMMAPKKPKEDDGE